MFKNNFLFISLIIFFACQIPEEKKDLSIKANPTFEDIAPIIFKNCTPCHRPSGAGPFALTNYEEVKKNGLKIKFVTKTRYMPPWPADASYSHFIGERILSEQEIELIGLWVNQNMPKGSSEKHYNAFSYLKKTDLQLPDTTIYFKEAIPIKGNGTDYFYIIKIPLQLKKDTFVRYFEFVPNQKKLVHHLNGHLINYQERSKKNIQAGLTYALDDFKDYNDLFKQLNILNDDGSFPVLTPNTVYYLPGYTPPLYPDNIGGYQLNKTAVILLKNIHYGPSNKYVLDSSAINIFYGSKPKRMIQETQLGTFGISKIEPELVIQPNQVQTFHTKATIQKDISLLSVNPHMHLLGKSFLAYAIKPNKDTINLIKINKWDFRWQYYYTYEYPIKIEAGSTIHVYGTFDNTNKNPFNPNHPPKLVSQGEGVRSMQTTEEMLQFIFSYLPYQTGDENLNLNPE